MPKKNAFTKEAIINAGLEIVREEGIDALSARAVAARVGCSVCPLFTSYGNMDGLKGDVVKAARSIYDGYIDKALKSPMPFKRVGEQYILFAVEEPKLFQLLFMHAENSFTPEGILPSIDDNYAAILKAVQSTYGLNEKKAFSLYTDMWIFSHGIASLSATGMINYSRDEVSVLLTEVCTALIIKYKREENDKG